ncbi:hypothetical protein [Nocardia sp. SSK8]|uniref:hypothetical protein n=1 Tax=Nocardia sp. SSK8 TaxID=3120154 RepID=UPI003008CCC1
MANIDPDEWKRLEGQAAAGELALNPEVGAGLTRVCDDHIAVLEDVLGKIQHVDRLTGFGTFNSSQILERKFSLTAAGGERSLDQTIREHIDAVTTAKEVVLKAIANFQAQDEFTAGQFNGLGEG